MQKLLAPTIFSNYETQIEIGPYRVDFAWPLWKVIAECDGFAKVTSSRDIEKWALRDAYLLSQGWVPVHLSWKQVNFRKFEALRIIRHAFIAQGWAEGLPIF